MRYTFPHYTPKPKFIQPDYSKWQAVQIGMARTEVIELLGPPHDDLYRSSAKARHDDPYFYYGFLQMPMLPHPRTYSFLIGFDNQGKVFTKGDPFNGKFSKDGTPTIPELIIPLNYSVFSHYPRILDIRWFPSSGVYPIEYSVRIELSSPDEPEEFWEMETEHDLPIPFYMTEFCSSSTGRFRVKAKNTVGESDWSDYRYFDFTNQ